MSILSRLWVIKTWAVVGLLVLATGWHSVSIGQSVVTKRLDQISSLLEANRDSPAPNAVELGNEALELLQEHPPSRMEVTIRLGLSWALSRRGNASLAESHARTASVLAEKLGDASARALAEYHVAVALYYQSKFSEASNWADRALQVQIRLGEQENRGTTLALLFAINRSLANYDRALELGLSALEVAQGLQDASAIARSNNNLGLLYWNLGQHEKALTFLRPALKTYRSEQSAAKLASVLSNLGLIHIELDQFETALQYLNEGVALHSQFDNPNGMAKLLSNLGFANDKLGLLDTALNFLEQSLELRQRLGDRIGLARSYGSIAGIYNQQGRLREAESYYGQALLHAQAAEARSEQSAIYSGLADVQEQLGAYSAALASHKAYREIADDLDSVQTRERIARLEAANAKTAQQRELEAVKREQAEQQLLQAKQQTRHVILGFASVMLALVVAGLIMLVRARTRSLAVINASHADLQRTSTALEQSEKKYRSVFDDQLTPKFLLDLERGSLLEANAPAVALCGPDRHSLPGTSMNELQPDWLRRALQTCAKQSQAEVCQAESWHDANGSLRHSEVWTTPLELDDRPCAVVTVHDVTEERQLEEERIKQDKLESLGLLAGGIAHDFNNALVAVLGHVSLAQYRAGDESDVQPLLSEAESAIQHAVQLTSQLLTFAKGGEPRRECSNVADQLTEAVSFALSGSPTSVKFELSDDLWAANLDAIQFKQAVGNLVLNAAQAIPEGGTIQVTARNMPAEERVSPSVVAGPHVAITIADTGPGIPLEIQDKILDPYFTTKESGSGLGLATAFAIVCRHRGWLDFQSKPGAGSSFTLYFPADPENAPVHLSESYVAPEGSGRILVMDDDPTVQMVYRVMLSRLGYDLVITSNGQEAIEAYRKCLGSDRRFDAVIMDLTVPGAMGGGDAMPMLAELDPNVKGVVASGYSNDPVMSNYRASGFAGTLSKPFSIQQLGRSLQQVFKHCGPR